MANNHWSAHLESFLGERHGRGGGWFAGAGSGRAVLGGLCRRLNSPIMARRTEICRRKF